MLIVESDGPILNVILNRPEVRNAFNDELIGALFQTFTTVPAGTRAIVLSGNGPSFCAGGDLEWMQKAASYTEEENVQDALRLACLFQAMLDCPIPIVANVHGHVFGGGCGLVAASDIAIAATKTVFAFSEVQLGLVPATISPFVLAKIGPGHARALFTTGERFDAQFAYHIGLVHTVALPCDLPVHLKSKLAAILSAGPEAIAVAKHIAQQPPMSMEEAAAVLAKARSGDEGREGVGAFLEKRTPSYKIER